MRIACLAWGSLVWKSEPLELATDWMRGGPSLPIELGYVGNDGELATVIDDGAVDVPTRWARLASTTMLDAHESLRVREGIPEDKPEHVGQVLVNGHEALAEEIHARIVAWARSRALDGVVWTALLPRGPSKEPGMPTLDEAVTYLSGLRGQTRAHAQAYVRRLPLELRTRYRNAIENQLGWTPTDYRLPPEVHVVVHRFQTWRPTQGTYLVSEVRGLDLSIMRIEGAELLPGSAQDVPSSALDEHGFVRPRD